MKRFLLAASLFAMTGCAHPAQEPLTPASGPLETVECPPEAAPVALLEEAPAARPESRPRLSKTLTLGAGTPDQYISTYGDPPPVPAGQGGQPGQGGTTIIVNNNIPAYGAGGYYGYGYGYGSYGGGYGRGARVYGVREAGGTSGVRGQSAFRGAWAPTGWEGAQRTAAPGQTPGVGGNWSPPTSYGPATMK